MNGSKSFARTRTGLDAGIAGDETVVDHMRREIGDRLLVLLEVVVRDGQADGAFHIIGKTIRRAADIELGKEIAQGVVVLAAAEPARHDASRRVFTPRWHAGPSSAAPVDPSSTADPLSTASESPV